MNWDEVLESNILAGVEGISPMIWLTDTYLRPSDTRPPALQNKKERNESVYAERRHVRAYV